MDVKGKLIVIDGSDFTGKTTLLQALKKDLEEKNIKVFLTKEPTNGPTGMGLRRILAACEPISVEQQINLFIKDRHEHQPELRQYIDEGYLVLCDRYYHSNIAYQDWSYEELKELNSKEKGILQPDIVFILDAPIDVLMSRQQTRNTQKELFENKEKLLQVKAKYERILNDNWTYPIVKIDSSGELDSTLETVIKCLDELISDT